MARIKELEYGEMAPDQQALHDEILSGPRDTIVGPMHGWFRSPELGSLMQKLGAYCRYYTSVPARLSELTIITVAQYWRQTVEWTEHKDIAFESGISRSIIDAIERGETPNFKKADEEIVHRLTSEISATRYLSDSTYQEALEQFGEKTLFELTSIIGYYTSLAIQMNCFEIQAPDCRDLF